MAITRVGDINIEYYVEGDGPPLLMIKGFGMSANTWGEPFLAALRPHFQIIRFSNRGTGLTDKPLGGYSIPTMADDAAGLLESLGIGATHVLGVSMGGFIAQELALNHLERLRGLVLGCTSCGRPHGVEADPETMAMIMPTPGISPEKQLRKAWPAILTSDFVEREQEFLAEMERILLETPTPVETLNGHAAAIMQFNSYDRLPGLRAATLIIHGDADRLIPVQNAHILNEHIPDSQLHILPGAGHSFSWEKPKEAAEAIVQFLSSVPAPT